MDVAKESISVSNFSDQAGLLVEALVPQYSSARMLTNSRQAKPKAGTPEAVDAAMDRIVEKLLPDLQRHLDSLSGKDFGEESNLLLAKSLTRLLRRLGCQISCDSCGIPVSAIRYGKAGNAVRGSWRFEHTSVVRHGGKRAVPRLQLVAGKISQKGKPPKS
jgi:hypothetical protein